MKRINWFNLLFQEGSRVSPKGFLAYIFVAFAVATSAFVVWLGSVGNMSPYQYSVIFLTGILPVAIITTRASKKASEQASKFDLVLAFLVFLSGLYLIVNVETIMNRISAVDPLSQIDLLAAFIITVAVFEMTRRTLGFGLTFLLIIGLGYVFFGHLLTGTFGHRELSVERFLEEMVFTSNGIFGAPVQVAATYAFLFIAFGHFFQKAGGGQFIFDLASVVAGRRVGGLGKVSVTTAGAFGSISGSPTADVATTGSINIPMMKKYGYTPLYAGAVEAASASGGTMLPPIMGSVAFLMVEFTSIPYIDIVVASLISALLYYLGVYMQVHFRSLKLNLRGMNAEEIPPVKTTLAKGFYFIIPVVVLIWAMHEGMTPSRAAIYGLAACFVISFFSRDTWLSPRKIIDTFTDVVYQIAPLVVATSAAGIIIGIISLTGMAGKFTSLIFTLTNGHMLLTLMLSAVICIVLGMGMPTPSVYVLVAALVAPALIALDLPVLQTHLFLIFFAAMSAITPPVGVAAYSAAGISGASPLATGVQATKLAIVGFIIPFMFVYNPELLMIGSWSAIALTIVTSIIGVYALAAGIEGYLHEPLAFWQRILLMAAGVVMIVPDVISNIVCMLIIGAFYSKKYMSKKNWRVHNVD